MNFGVEVANFCFMKKCGVRKVNTMNKEQALSVIAEEDFSRRTLSFYKYVQIEDPHKMRDLLFEKLDNMGCKGRIYVAEEGINAQMNVPLPLWGEFDALIQSTEEFAGIPYKIAREETEVPSFWKLTVKVKKKVVADGLDDASFDPGDTGKYMDARQVNQAIDDPETLVVDMRNQYEAEVGHFPGAHIMQVDTFQEQLASVEDELGDQKEQKVLMYCTGGIRCEKASAWFKHKGFSDVAHIKGGIIDYDRQVKEEGLENKFKGKNFVFDERLGERISDDVVAKCHLCEKNPADTHYNCQNLACHTLYIACETCRIRFGEYCSTYCTYFDKIPAKPKKVITRWQNKFKKKYSSTFRKTKPRKAL